MYYVLVNDLFISMFLQMFSIYNSSCFYARVFQEITLHGGKSQLCEAKQPQTTEDDILGIW